MKLSERLRAIAEFVETNSIVADIGTDHGHIPAYLIENKIAKKVIGSDISEGSLEKIKEYIRELEMEDKVDTRLGDGLEVIEAFEVDTLIIAGMGGLLIKEILDRDREKTKGIVNFILQPMVAVKELRQYLLKNGFKIIDEDLVKEDEKYYEIIYAKKGKAYVEKDIDYEISPILLKKNKPLLKDYINFKINGARLIMEEIRDIDSEKTRERYEELDSLIKSYKEVLVKIEG